MIGRNARRGAPGKRGLDGRTRAGHPDRNRVHGDTGTASLQHCIAQDAGNGRLNFPIRRTNAWYRWLTLAGVKAPQKLEGAVFDHFFLNLHAASNHLGVVIGSLVLVEDDVAAGRLARLFPESVIRDEGFHMLYRAHRHSDPALQVFTDWLGVRGSGHNGPISVSGGKTEE